MAKIKHKLLNIPLIEIMEDKTTLAKIFNLAFNLTGNQKKYSKKLIFKYNKKGKDTYIDDYISIRYYIYNGRKYGIYTTHVEVGYSDTSGIEVSVTNTCISTPSNEERISSIIKKSGWVKEDILYKRKSEIERQLHNLKYELRSITTKCYYS